MENRLSNTRKANFPFGLPPSDRPGPYIGSDLLSQRVIRAGVLSSDKVNISFVLHSCVIM